MKVYNIKLYVNDMLYVYVRVMSEKKKVKVNIMARYEACA